MVGTAVLAKAVGAASGTNSGLTDELKERMRKKREEALMRRAKRAKLTN